MSTTVLRPVRPAAGPALRHPLDSVVVFVTGAGERDSGLPLPVALLLAAAAGPLLDAAFPDRGWWPFAYLGIGLALAALRGRGSGGALLVGLVFGAAFFFLHIEWATTFLGPIPWTALSTLMALWCSLGGLLIALAYRWVPRVWTSRLARLTLLPAIVAGLWTAREAVSAVWPYGGFSWGRVAFSQSESPVSGLFSWLGTSGTGFAMVFLVAMTLEAVRELRVDGLARAALVTSVAALLVVTPAFPVSTTGNLRVGAVQGNTKAGYFDPPDRVGDNLAGQIVATEPLVGEDVDVVLWPEGGSDLDPLADASAERAWDRVVAETGAPLVGGTITARGDEYFNTVLQWDADGAVDAYDKKHPVPFGEYVPDRAFWRQFAPELIDLVGREYTPGTTDSVLDLGDAVAGVAICFDIVDDALMRGSIADGADILFAPTNNADFGMRLPDGRIVPTDEGVQQLAIARVRALELGRSVVNISTVGTSAIIAPDGRELDRLPTYEVGRMLRDVPLSTTVTPAAATGAQTEGLAVGVGLLGLLVAGTSGIRRTSSARAARADR